MNASPFFDWLARTSWQASVLVLLVLAAQRLFRRRLNARWHYALWLLVVARLAMPSLPASSWSVFNVLHYAAKTTDVTPAKLESPRPMAANSVNDSFPDSGVVPETITRGHLEPTPPPVATAMFDKRRLVVDAEIVWLAGLLLLGGRGIGQSIVFVRRLRGAKAVTDSEMLALFAGCKEIMGVSAPLRLAETDQVSSPALYGFFRPSLLLPRKIMGQFTPDEQRHIFLHELAHVKRRDMAVHWVAAVFRLLHWFNPVLWFGFQRMAADRELACDEMALGRAGEEEARPYGETVLKLLELCARPAVLPGLMGILEEKSQMTRRILMIARYKQQAGWPIVAMLLLAGLGLVTFTDAQIDKSKSDAASAVSASRPDLIGQVHLTNGQPLIATVFISTAGPKIGTSAFCPSCYADCVKRAKSDAQGRFKIESLDPDLIFRILVVAKDYAPKYVTKIDPAKGPVDVILDPRNNADSPPGNTLHGRVVDGSGAPIVGAAVEANGIQTRDGGGRWGTLPGVDPLAVTDERGEFLITSIKPFAMMAVKVEARGFAQKTFTELSSGTARHDLTITEGATVSGRVMWKGKPLSGVSVGVVSTDRTPEQFAGNYEVGTDANGRFAFLNLPQNIQYNLYGIMQTVQKYGAVTPTHVSTGADGSSADAGDLVVGAAYRIAGRVILDGGAPIPAKTRLMIGSEEAWDSLNVELDKDGRFDAAGIPPGVVNISVRVPGYSLSLKNGSLDRLNDRLVGRVESDIASLTILLNKGKRDQPDMNDVSFDIGPEKLPLRGIEGGPPQEEAQSKNWIITGHVTDAGSGQPLKNFVVTPANRRHQQLSFDSANQAQGENGVFTVKLSKRFANPPLKIEAEGYIPIAVAAPQGDTSNFEVKAQPGSGPSGVVLAADGKPAANVTVGLIFADSQGMSISGDGELQAGWRTKNTTKSGADGSFSFPAELEMQAVVVASPQGFKLVSISNFTANPKIALEPWGRITGILRRPSGPGTNEALDLAFAQDVLENQNGLNAGGHAVTDGQGRFEFDRVPPARLDLTYRVKINENMWHPTLLQSVTVIPGQTLDLKIDAPERETRAQQFSPIQSPLAKRTGNAITGTVFLPDGKPARGVHVALEVPSEYLALGKAELKTGNDKGLETTTDAGGNFSLPGVEGATGIVAVHEVGFARIGLPATNSPSLILQPWGEIHGILRVGRRVGAKQGVVLNSGSDQGLIYNVDDFKAQTDDQGRFVMTYVPPGKRDLARVIPMEAGSWNQSIVATVNVKPGGITELTIGGTGKKVVGLSVIQGASAAFNWSKVSFYLRNEPPPGTDKQRLPVWDHYFADLTTNGSFVFEDVAPGSYELSATAIQTGNGPFDRRVVAEGSKKVVIPEVGAGHDGELYDIGTLELQSVHPLNIGDAAASVEAETPDGRKVHLADFRGKYVLMTILTDNFGGRPALPQLKETFDEFGKDDRLGMFSITYLPAPELTEYARTNGIGWTVATLTGHYSQLQDYFESVNNLRESQTFLIDPQGRILGKGLQGAAIKEAVAKALARK